MKSFTQWVRSVGGDSAIIQHKVNENAQGWYGYWQGLIVTLYLGKSSVTKEWSYYEFCELMRNDHGSDSWDVTGQAQKAARYAKEYLEAHGYFVVSE